MRVVHMVKQSEWGKVGEKTWCGLNGDDVNAVRDHVVDWRLGKACARCTKAMDAHFNRKMKALAELAS